MATTNFVDGVTTIQASWLNDVDEFVYKRRWINAFDYGVVGDGITDDSTALQNALTAAGTEGASLFIPHGSYLVPSAILTVPDGVSVYGEGDNTEIIRGLESAVPLLEVPARSKVTVSNLKLSSVAGLSSTTSVSLALGAATFDVEAGKNITMGQTLSISSVTDPTKYGLATVVSYIGTALQVNFTTVSAAHTTDNWKLDIADGNSCALRFLSSTDCYADNVTISGRFYVGMVIQNSTSCGIKNSTVNGVVNRAVYVYGTSGATHSISVTNNRIKGNTFTQYAVNINGSGGSIYDVIISLNKITDCVFQGIEAGGSTSDVVISSNLVRGVTGVGILAQRANGSQPSKIIITNNDLTSCTTGIYVLDTFYTKVVGNNIGTGSVGILIAQVTAAIGCQYATVSGNHVNNMTSNGISYQGANVGLCSYHNCTNNFTVACVTGIASVANTDRIIFTGNLSVVNTTAYNILGTNHVNVSNL